MSTSTHPTDTRIDAPPDLAATDWAAAAAAWLAEHDDLQIPTPRTEPTSGKPNRPRVWLVAGGHDTDPPVDMPTAVRDPHRTWRPGPDGRWHCGLHSATWAELRVRFDLVEAAA